MFNSNLQKKYNCVLILEQALNKFEIQSLVYENVKLLKKLGAVDINAVLKNDFILTYPIQKNLDVKFIEVSFFINSQALESYTRQLRLEESILRFFLFIKD